jgi:hypothetical protein
LTLLLPFVFGGCVADGTNELRLTECDDQIEITVTVPAASLPTTRSIAGADGEAVVSELDVLVFKSGTNPGDPQILTERASGTIVNSQSTSSGDRYRVTFTVGLTDDPAARTIAVIANATGEVNKALTAAPVGSAKQLVLAALQYKSVTVAGWQALDSDNYTPIPMYGEAAVASGITSGMTISDIELTRMLARIDVVNSAYNFTVTNIYLWGRRDRGYISPAWNPANGTIVSPQPATPKDYGGLYGSYLMCQEPAETDLENFTGRIYTYEAPTTDGVENSTAHNEAACLIIGGKIDGDATEYFYRVDFTDPADINGKRPGETGYDPTKLPAPGDVKYMPLHRNHLYSVDIKQVDAPGYIDMNDARSSLGVLSNLHTEMHVVDQSGINDIVFDGQHWLGTDESLLVFRGEGGPENGKGLDVRTNYYDGWDAVNIKYGATGGSGWLFVPTSGDGMDGTSAKIYCGPYAGNAPRTATFTLTAGRLRKTITVVQLPMTKNILSDAVIPNSYVGAFWKASQTGERLIRIPKPASGADGAWTATVLEGEDWITLDRTMTSDANVGWRTDVTPTEASVDNGNDAGFDYTHAVRDGAEYVTGRLGATPVGSLDPFDNDPTQIYFRIGLKSEYTPTADAPARYGLVLLTYKDNTLQQRIWIRQGEEADYLFSTKDAASRTAAMPFSPYNLTAETLNAQVGINGNQPNPGIFTDYPSQAGGYFQWASKPTDARFRYVWDAFSTSNEILTYTGVPNAWSTYAADNETCPEGYRRPADGPADAPTVTMTDAYLAISEVRQSLYLKPVITQTPAANTAVGYYADGFFDRRQIVKPTQGLNDGTAASAVSIDNQNIAYRGIVYYNSSSLSSLFLPYAGARESMNAPVNSLRWQGTKVVYPSTATPTGGTHLYIGFGNTLDNTTGRKTNGTPIRCVKAPPIPPENITDDPVPAGITPYVGAFWKADQTGERLIRIARPTTGTATVADGKWTAQVIEGKDWITLDKTMTTDTNVGWLAGAIDGNADFGNDTDFDTKYQVTDGDWWVMGTMDAANDIYFRIGLKSEYTPTETAPARYGVVLLTYADNSLSQRIWIRQGEDADYLMRSEDPKTGGGVRTPVAKLSPYNLTAQKLNAPVSINGATDDPSLTSAIFTDYPSQGGALWQWSAQNEVLRFAWPPLCYTGALTGWNSAEGSTTWTAENESCPAGYRRPADDNAEMRQSLFLGYKTGLTDSRNADIQNETWGYYADGYFDRRNIVDAVKVPFETVTVYEAVGYDTAEPLKSAFIGGLFYNPATNASLFFPAPGSRETNGTSVGERVGGSIYYVAPASAFRFAIRKDGSNNGSGPGQKAVAASIRCVKK